MKQNGKDVNERREIINVHGHLMLNNSTEKMESTSERVVVVVEEAEASRTALRWATRNLLRCGDTITLLHVCQATRSKSKRRIRRRRGFQLALSFKDLCNGIAEARVEIIVMEGDQGALVASVVNKIRASALVVGLHHQSFLYTTAMPNLDSLGIHGCRILAVKQHSATSDGFMSTEYSQVEITRLSSSERKNVIPMCPFCLGMKWRRSRRRK